MVWTDACAPEPALDMDAPHVTLQKAIVMWLGGLGFFFTLYQLAGLKNPPSLKPTVRAAMPVVKNLATLSLPPALRTRPDRVGVLVDCKAIAPNTRAL